MPLTSNQIKDAFNKFSQPKNYEHRYASFDYCYNYFHQFKNKDVIASKENIEKSCLHLGFYLGSWGMMRASSFLLQQSLQFHKPIIKWIANECPKEVWKIDLNNYNEQSISLLINTYNELCKFIPEGKRQLVLVTKIMLGVFGNTPAFDNYFTNTFRAKYGKNSRYRKFDSTALQSIKYFYDTNDKLIEMFRKKSRTINFSNGQLTNRLYTRAKIIDMIGFGHSYKAKD